MRNVLEELPSRVVNEYQVQGGDLAILPVGSVEVLGPHLPLGAKGFLSQAFSLLLAQKANGLVLPVVPFSPVIGTGDRAGSIDTNETAINDFVRAIAEDLYATGFRRILVVTDLDYLRYYLPHEFYEDHQVALAGVHLSEIFEQALAAHNLSRDSLLLGACQILGKTELVEKCLAAARDFASKSKETPLPAAYQKLVSLGIVGGHLPGGQFPVVPGEKLDAAAGERMIRETVERITPALESLRAYNEYLSRRGSRGFLKGNWFRKTQEAI